MGGIVGVSMFFAHLISFLSVEHRKDSRLSGTYEYCDGGEGIIDDRLGYLSV
jgi:hypothetical protein